MKLSLLKKKKIKIEGLFGPSTVIKGKSKKQQSTSENVSIIKLPKKAAKSSRTKPPSPEEARKAAKLDEAAKQIEKNSKDKKTKYPFGKKSKKLTPEQNAIIDRNYETYLAKFHAPCWGNTLLEPDDKGFDGFADLKLSKQVCEVFKLRNDVVLRKVLAGDETALETIAKFAAYNAWQWSNFCSRVWVKTLNEQPPIRRIVGIKISDLIPFAENPHVLDKTVAYLMKHQDVKTAFSNLGFCKTKVRLLPIFDVYVSPATLYKLHELFVWQKTSYSIKGFITADDVNNPRDICILKLTGSRKSALQKLMEAKSTGHRVIIDFATLKGDLKSVKEVKASQPYQVLTQTWNGLTPLIAMPLDSKMELIRKVSQLGDILLA